MGAVGHESSFLGMYFLVFYSIFKAMPNGYTEAAKVDGAGNLRILLQIVMPLVRQYVFYRCADYVHRLLERLSNPACVYAYTSDRSIRTFLPSQHGSSGRRPCNGTDANGGRYHDVDTDDYTVFVLS